jgi:hypothetical protein
MVASPTAEGAIMSSSSKKKSRPLHPITKPEMRAAFKRLVEENPGLADATLTGLRIIASANRQRAMQLAEVVATIVASSPRKAPGSPEAS